jgi:hypothetical protein
MSIVSPDITFAFTGDHLYHDGQFVSAMADRWTYWYRVLVPSLKLTIHRVLIDCA